MPKLSPDTLLRRAAEPAALDRQSFADAYGGSAPEAIEALEFVRAIKQLRTLRLSQMTPEQLEVARLTFVYAEQWESSLADALPRGVDRRQAEEKANRFREARLRIWGKTDLEHILDTACSVPVFPIDCAVR